MAITDAGYEAGIRYFDTSPYYGYGRSELRMGAALRDKPPRSAPALPKPLNYTPARQEVFMAARGIARAPNWRWPLFNLRI